MEHTLLDCVAPFGHARVMTRMLQRHLFASRVMRSLSHRGEERGLRIKTCQGIAVLPEEARLWFAAHRVQFPPDSVARNQDPVPTHEHIERKPA